MRLRLIASFLLLVLVTIGIFIVVTSRQTAREVRNFMFRGGLTGREEVVIALEEYYATHGTWEGVVDVLRKASRFPRRGMWGQGMGRENNQVMEPLIPPLRLVDVDGNPVANSLNSEFDPLERLSNIDLNRAFPLKREGETVGYLLPENNPVFTTANEVSLVTRLNQAALTAVVVAGGVAVTLALLLSYRLVKPVRILTKAAAELAAGDLAHRVKLPGNDEFATLGLAFNRLAESLQKAERSRQALTADIAHELRTPLAVQRAHLEAIEDGVYPLSLESIKVIEEQNHLLTRLVEDLRTLASADSGQLNLEFSVMDISDLVRRVSERFEPQASERGIQIQAVLDQSSPLIKVDPQRIQQILHNLLDNAVRYSPDGGNITLELDHVPNQVILTVRDNGPGIPEDLLPNIFDRFYRGDKSRTRLEGGTGLGLSIARKLALAHGGDLTAGNHPDGGAVFQLMLPIDFDRNNQTLT